MIIRVTLLFALGFISCKNSPEAPHKSVPIQVKAVAVLEQDIKEYVTFNGVVQYQRKENIRSNVTGYLSELSFDIGSHIRSGQTFATIRTKEQEALLEVAKIDSSLARFATPMHIQSNATGIITNLNVVKNDYIAEGDILATIAQPQSLAVLVSVPYEFVNTMGMGTKCEITLQNNKKIEAEISGILPVIDPVAQSQSFLIALPGHEELPENLNVRVRAINRESPNAMCVPHEALQTNEILTDFWVMKVVHDTLAVKVRVTPILQNDSLIQIASDNIRLNDLVITEGGYQMQDSTIVSIQQ